MVMPRFLFNLFFFLACVLLCSTAYANVSLEPQRTVFSISDSIDLALEFKGDNNNFPSSQPDLSPLQAMFDITGQKTQKSSNMKIQIGNGKTERVTETRYSIILSVSPKQEGQQTIPSITWGQFKTQPVQINVTPQATSQSTNGVQADFFAEAQVTNTSPYVQEQIILTVKAYSTDRFNNGGFGMRFPDNVIAKLTGQDDKIYKTAINGQSYFVQERQFILYVERSGETTLPPITFTSQVLTNQVDSFGFRLAKNQRTKTQAIKLNVRPMPSSASNQAWLPAHSLSLSHYLEKDNYEVGTPMTLTLSTVAEGIISEQMPQPNLSALQKNFKIYPDQPELKSRWDNGAVISTRVDKIALIPIKAGKQSIPAITLDWWNTKKDQAETAKTAPINIHVKASANDTPNTLPTLNANAPTTEDSTAMLEKISQLEASASQRVSKYWQYATVFFALLCAGLILLMVKLKNKNHTAPKSPQRLSSSIGTSEVLKHISHDPKRAHKYILLWARANIDPSMNNLRDIITYCNQSADHKELAESLVQLNKCLYDSKQSNWDAEKLKKAIKQFKLNQPDTTKQNSFLKLYPKN